MFKVLILQSLYNLSDGQTEFQIRDRFTFLRFLGLTPQSRIPDEKTIWAFRESVKARGLNDELFQTFTRFLEAQGFKAQRGTVIDARIVEVPKQRNTRSENATIKEGLMLAEWQKHTAKKESAEGYRGALGAKERQELLWLQEPHCDRRQAQIHPSLDVTPAHVHDSQCFELLLDRKNSNPTVYVDSAYRSDEH